MSDALRNDYGAPVRFIEFVAPIETRCEANRRDGHWAQRKRRVSKQRGDFALCWKANVRPAVQRALRLPLTVTWTRIAPRKLDKDDGLNSAFKHVRDELAAILGFNDATDEVRWEYRQEKGKPNTYAIRIRIEAV